jgi:hypothetical protein
MSLSLALCRLEARDPQLRKIDKKWSVHPGGARAPSAQRLRMCPVRRDSRGNWSVSRGSSKTNGRKLRKVWASLGPRVNEVEGWGRPRSLFTCRAPPGAPGPPRLAPAPRRAARGAVAAAPANSQQLFAFAQGWRGLARRPPRASALGSCGTCRGGLRLRHDAQERRTRSTDDEIRSCGGRCREQAGRHFDRGRNHGATLSKPR